MKLSSHFYIFRKTHSNLILSHIAQWYLYIVSAGVALDTRAPGLFRGLLSFGVFAFDPVHGREGTSWTAEMRMRVASPTRAREVEGSARSGQRGQDKLQSNPRESQPGANYNSLRVRRKRGVAPVDGASAECAPSTPPACEALRQMPADRETLVSLKRAAEKPRRSTTSTDRDRRRASPSSGARCRPASKTISSKSG